MHIADRFTISFRNRREEGDQFVARVVAFGIDFERGAAVRPRVVAHLQGLAAREEGGIAGDAPFHRPARIVDSRLFVEKSFLLREEERSLGAEDQLRGPFVGVVLDRRVGDADGVGRRRAPRRGTSARKPRERWPGRAPREP